ncbi:hypothetical protein [Desulfobacula toluolica]|uniref:hypothetical protein n=1 Tax=Desulfobacula toluolica TaxID=28223 RepID=UPI00059C8269|nr:hypothetical protein [Desulfobacula toluolica]
MPIKNKHMIGGDTGSNLKGQSLTNQSLTAELNCLLSVVLAKRLHQIIYLHMLEIWLIPAKSQQIFNAICKLLHDVPQDKSRKTFHYLYREKILEFFMRLEKCEIKVVKDDSLLLLTNAFQLHKQHKINKGLYLGTTGHWLNHHKKPPSVIS